MIRNDSILHPEMQRVGWVDQGKEWKFPFVFYFFIFLFICFLREVGPALYCDRQCGGLQCGGRHQGRAFYSLYCLHQGRLAWGHDTQANFSHRSEHGSLFRRGSVSGLTDWLTDSSTHSPKFKPPHWLSHARFILIGLHPNTKICN